MGLASHKFGAGESYLSRVVLVLSAPGLTSLNVGRARDAAWKTEWPTGNSTPRFS